MLKKWFEQHKREFPWRRQLSPYHVWVSEVMLQQTLAKVVVPYFDRWISLFPTVQDLASAPIDSVIKAWEGLGYYSRARNLHAGAQQIVETFNGKMPNTREELLSIKGIGSYTAGAILSFAFHQKAAAVDGNVMRVMSRLQNIEEDISKPATVKMIHERVEAILPDHEPWVTMEALIELGATVCKKDPSCSKCPMRAGCQAYQLGLEKELPYKSKKLQTIKLIRSVFVLMHHDKVLLKLPEEGKVMQDLFEFPYSEAAKEWTLGMAHQFVREYFGTKEKETQKLSPVTHTFTKYRVRLYPFMMTVDHQPEIEGCRWVKLETVQHLSFSSGHRRVLQQVIDSLQLA